jgi:hypothetical protein
MKRLMVVVAILFFAATAPLGQGQEFTKDSIPVLDAIQATPPPPDSGLVRPIRHHCGNISDPPYPVVIMPDGSCNYDSAREPITLAVIHHLEASCDASLEQISQWGWDRLYGPNRRRSSGHYYDFNGERKEVYWAYHWLIRCDGTVVRLLPDSAIGWHARNNAANRYSIGIVLAGNWLKRIPPERMRAAIEEILAMYPTVEDVKAHREVGLGRANGNKDCPGQWYARWRREYEPRFRLRPVPTPPEPETQPSFFNVEPLFSSRAQGFGLLWAKENTLCFWRVFSKLLLEQKTIFFSLQSSSLLLSLLPS